MKSYTSLFVIVVLACFASAGFAQLAASAPVAVDANAVSTPAFPYAAEITGDNVYVRSGYGTNYYNSGKINKGDKVMVVRQQFSWSCIVPPAGSFSWIYVPFVTIDPDKPGTGIVTGDRVRVYAGSDLVKPIHSTLQLKLNKGEKVTLLGEQKDNYYKIAPPNGAYLWVSTQFTKPILAGAGAAAVVVKIVDANAPAAVKDVDVNEVKITPIVPPDPPTPPAPKLSIETKLLAEYNDLQKKLLVERGKPLARQNYSGIRKAFEKIAATKDAGKVARYCEHVLEQVERYELVVRVSTQLGLQNRQLKATRDRIAKARSTRLGQVKNLGRFAVVGKFQKYRSGALKLYKIVDDSGKTVCYARAAAGTGNADYSKLVGKKVGLVGEISPYLSMSSALIKFTRIEQIK